MNQLLIWLFLIFAVLLAACIFNPAPSDLTLLVLYCVAAFAIIVWKARKLA